MYDKFNSIDYEATQKLVTETITSVNSAVCSTMGPNGKLAIISNGTSIKTTKDGVTVAKSIRFEDPFKEVIGRLITEPAVKTDEECGDGTTTTIFLTTLLYEVLHRFYHENGFVNHLYIERIINKVIDKLSDMSIEVEPKDDLLYQTALTSSNNDEDISRLVVDIFKSSDGFPLIELKEGIGPRDSIGESGGLPLQMKFSNPIFSDRGQGEETLLKQPIPIVIDNRLSIEDKDALIAFSKDLIEANKEGTYLIVARTVDNEVNQLIAGINNHCSYPVKKIKFVVTQTNMGGSVGTNLMQDLAVIFNTKLLSGVEGLSLLDLTPMEDELVVGGQRSLLPNPSDNTKQAIKERIEVIKETIGGYVGTERFSPIARFNEQRIRNLSGELITIFVGGDTISDIKERIDRYEDVVKAVKSAIINGVLPGSGVSLARAGREVLKDIEPTTNAEKEIVACLKLLFHSQYLWVQRVEWDDLEEMEKDELKCTNLVTGEQGTPEELGIYDTAYSSITALKGGFKTAQILSKLNTVLLGDKISSVKIN